MWNDRLKTCLPPAMVVLASFGLYVLTAAPMITAGDAGELVAAAYTLGIAHPPGYPLFALAGKLVSFVPLGDVAYRMNVMSGAFMSLSALTAYMLMGAIEGRRRLVHAAAALAAALCFESWGLAVAAEVYPLQLFLSLFSLYMLVRWHGGGGAAFLYAGAFVSGLSVVAHYTGLVFLPAFALVFALRIGREERVKAGALSAAFFLAGLSVFAYLAVRSSAAPPINWGTPDTLGDFFRHIARAKYGDLGAFRMLSGGGGAAPSLGLAGSGSMALAAVVVLAAVMAVLLKKRMGAGVRLLPAAIAALTCLYLAKLAWTGIGVEKAAYFGGLLRKEYWLGVPPFAALYLFWQYRKDRDLFYSAALLLACLTAVLIYRVPVDRTEYILPLAGKFFVPWFFLTAVFGGVAAGWLSGEMERRGLPAALRAAPPAAAAAFAVFLAAANYGPADSSRIFWPHDYADSMARTFEQDSIFLAEGDHHPFFMIYAQTVERARPDVTPLDSMGNVFGTYDEMRRIYAWGSRPVYCSQEAETGMFPDLTVLQAGILNRWEAGSRPGYDPAPYYVFRARVEDAEKAEYTDRALYANFNYHMARRLVGMGEHGLAEVYLQKAVKVGGDIVWVRVNAGNVYNYWKMPMEAIAQYMEAIRLAPDRAAAYINAGNIYIANREYALAERMFAEAARVDPKDPEPRLRLQELKSLNEADFR